MRSNIVRTQKAMKQMRETVLAAAETDISKPIFETLDTLIDRNRRANYRVSPTRSYPAHVRLDDGKILPVLEVSEGYVKVAGRTKDLTTDPSFWAGVLVVPTSEILCPSGRYALDTFAGAEIGVHGSEVPSRTGELPTYEITRIEVLATP